MSDRLNSAAAIRDHVLKLMEGRAEWQTIGGVKIQTWKDRGFNAALNTPFNPMPSDLPPQIDYVHALAMQKAKKPMAYELSLWRDGKGKVLSVEWDNSDIRIITFKRGEWEQQLMEIGK